MALAPCSISIAQELKLERIVESGNKILPVDGEAFRLDGNDAFIIAPRVDQKNIPWVWYAPTLRGLPGKEEAWMIERFLKAGIAIAGIDVGESYGSPGGTARYTNLYNYLVEKRNFSKKPVLLARSRGGLMLYSWAADNADKVSAIAGIYPVCNLESYPGLERACGAYEITATELRRELSTYNPIDRLGPLAKKGIPLFHIHGDVDKVVPLEANSGLVAERYKGLGGAMTLQVMEGQGHNMWSGWFQSQDLVDFVIATATRN